MKGIHLFLGFILLIMSSCTLTNEKRAERLVSSCIKDYLTYPDSYEAILTRVDSTRINVSTINEILEHIKDLEETYSKATSIEQDMESAQTTMEIFAPSTYFFSEHERGMYNRAKTKYEKCKQEIKQVNEKLHEQISNIRGLRDNIYSTDINGWIVTHRFRSKGDDGVQMPPQEMMFFCDTAFEHCQGWVSEQYELIMDIIKHIKDSQTDEELVDILIEH